SFLWIYPNCTYVSTMNLGIYSAHAAAQSLFFHHVLYEEYPDLPCILCGAVPTLQHQNGTLEFQSSIDVFDLSIVEWLQKLMDLVKIIFFPCVHHALLFLENSGWYTALKTSKVEVLAPSMPSEIGEYYVQ